MAGRSVTVTATATLPIATLPEVRQLVDSAAKKNTDSTGAHHPGVIGIRARLEWAGATDISHDGVPVQIELCPSALAVREALRKRGPERWLVIITDREESDLGTGILSHLQGQMLRTPNPWNAVREQFAADRVDRRLVTHPRKGELAAGFLGARGERPWLPARGGLLTYDHAFASVVGRWLDLGHASDPVIEDVLRWSAKESQSAVVKDLRDASNDVLAEATLSWLASRCGRAERLVAAVMARAELDDLVPLGLAGRAVLACPDGSEPWVRLQLQRLDLDAVSKPELVALVEAAERVLRDLILDDNDTSRRHVGRLLSRADAIVGELRAESGVEESLLLQGSLGARLAHLGDELLKAVESATTRASTNGPDSPLADPDRLDRIEHTLQAVQGHLLARLDKEERVPRALSAARLTRWLAVDFTSPTAPTFVDLMHRHRDHDAWVDRAYADTWRGVDEPALARGLAAVAAAVRLRRDRHDAEFAQALAAATSTTPELPADTLLMEDVLSRLVVPLARDQQPVLLIVADGMSAAVATEVVDDIEGHYDSWTECLPAGQTQRSSVVAVLPSLTETSRCSLLSGTLTTGQQSAEQRGFAELMKAHGLTSVLFHKLSLESSGAGTDLAPDVRAAVDNVAGLQVVACVLNTIDDALDRSDPGIDWTSDAVAHLRPLMEQARRAGRLVVLTSDHGHVVERREGRMEPAKAMSSNRSKPYGGTSLSEGEVRVTGSRVLHHDGDAVLAVDERLRYGPMKAGYHGGAAPAEVVVPLHVLTPGEAPAGWQLAPPQMPTWWQGVVHAQPAPVAAVRTQLPKSDLPTLFDEVDTEPKAVVEDLATRVIASPAYAAQRARATRVSLKDERVEILLRVLLSAPGHRLDPASAATALGVAKVQLAGAVPMLQRLLNIEQYAVLERDTDGQTLVLDADLLAEQFGVTR